MNATMIVPKIMHTVSCIIMPAIIDTITHMESERRRSRVGDRVRERVGVREWE